MTNTTSQGAYYADFNTTLDVRQPGGNFHPSMFQTPLIDSKLIENGDRFGMSVKVGDKAITQKRLNIISKLQSYRKRWEIN